MTCYYSPQISGDKPDDDMTQPSSASSPPQHHQVAVVVGEASAVRRSLLAEGVEPSRLVVMEMPAIE